MQELKSVEVYCGEMVHMVQSGPSSWVPQEPGLAQLTLTKRGFRKKRDFENGDGSRVQIWEKKERKDGKETNTERNTN